MYEVATFIPIEKTIKKDVLDYLNENSMSLPDHPLIKDYFSLPEETDVNIESNFYVGSKTGSKPKRQTIKQNPPRFTVWKSQTEQLASPEEWPQKDHSFLDLLNKAKGTTLDKQRFSKELETLNLSKEDQIFATKLAEKESSFRPFVPNQLGYFGYYQFGKDALKDVGFTKEDLKNPINQHIALLRYKEKNVKPFKDYIGKIVNGIKLTENKIAAAAHLAGASGLKDWLNNTEITKFAKRGFTDANGTHITKYLKEF